MRNLIVFSDDDGGVNAALLPPEELSRTEARKQAENALEQAQKKSPEEWNYGDVVEILTAKGYEQLHEIEIFE